MKRFSSDNRIISSLDALYPMIRPMRLRGMINMQEARLPWSTKEMLLYGAVISLITSLIMCEFNLFKSAGASFDVFIDGLISLPAIWMVVMLNFIVEPVACKVVQKYTEPTDSFYTKIVFNIIPCVLMMSAIMTIVGSGIGHLFAGNLSLQIVYDWPSNWPVNFCVAFWVEMLVAQPAARHLMKCIHASKVPPMAE